MKFFTLVCAFLAIAPAIFSQEVQKDRPKPKEGQILLEFRSQHALSYENAAKQSICELTKTSVMLFRADGKGGKRKATTVRADRGIVESKPGAGPGKITLSGNVRAEEVDGTIISATEAVIDLVEETLTFKKRISLVTQEK
jgi:hypothetical protein